MLEARQKRMMPDLLGMLWRVLRQPWLLIGVGALALLSILCALLLPQISTSVAADPSSAVRWFIRVSADYGAVGNLLRGLGLFDLLHSTLLRVLILALGLLVAIHLAEEWAAIALFRSLKQLIQTRSTAGEATTLPQALPLFRVRESRQGQVDTAVAHLSAELTDRFGQIEEFTVPSTEMGADEKTANKHLRAEVQPEIRLLGIRHQNMLYLRLLLLFGLLLGLGTMWFSTLQAWVVAPPPIAPGESYSYAPQNLELRYTATAPLNAPDEPVRDLALQIQIGDRSGTLPVDSASRIYLDNVAIEAQPGPPGLLVSSVNGAEILAVQDQTRADAGVGLIFPGEGNEQVVRLPQQSIGLRIVRSSSGPAPDYRIEIIDVLGGIERVSRQVELQSGQSQLVEINDGRITLRFDPLPALDVRVRHLPNLWLLMVVFALLLVGAIGLFRRPAFAVIQIAPWEGDKVAIIAQSNRKDEIEWICKS